MDAGKAGAGRRTGICCRYGVYVVRLEKTQHPWITVRFLLQGQPEQDPPVMSLKLQPETALHRFRWQFLWVKTNCCGIMPQRRLFSAVCHGFRPVKRPHSHKRLVDTS